MVAYAPLKDEILRICDKYNFLLHAHLTIPPLLGNGSTQKDPWLKKC